MAAITATQRKMRQKALHAIDVLKRVAVNDKSASVRVAAELEIKRLEPTLNDVERLERIYARGKGK